MKCEQCETLLFDFQEGALGDELSSAIDTHLKDCSGCNELLADIWQMKLVASRWQDEQPPVPSAVMQPVRRVSVSSLFATAASVLALVLVLADVHLASDNGRITIQAGMSGQMLNNWRAEQQAMTRSIEALSARQVASDQLVLRSVLETSREERREELRTLLAYWNDTQGRRYRETEENLRYLLASQAEDEKDIRQLSDAMTLQLRRTTNNY